MHSPYGVVRAPLRAVRILFFSQIRLKDRFQHDDPCHLCHSVFDSRYSQRPLLTIWFGNQNPPNPLGSVAPLLQFLGQLIQPPFHPFGFDLSVTLRGLVCSSRISS